MPFIANIPQAQDFLNVTSQPQLLANNLTLDAAFGIDHYPFSDVSANQGFHNQMTTPLIIGGVHPTTAVGVPKMYAMQDSVPAGVLDYSRGGNNAVPTPITNLHSPATGLTIAPSGVINLLDFTGLARAFCSVYYMYNRNASPTLSANEVFVAWSGTVFNINPPSPPTSGVTFTGNILQFINNESTATYNNFFWTIRLHRMQ